MIYLAGYIATAWAAVSAGFLAARSAWAVSTAEDGVWAEQNAELERLLWLLAPSALEVE